MSSTDPDHLATLRWDARRAHAWCAERPWPVGGNFLPSTASNQLEMWQADTFDPATIERELGWAAAIGMTSMRIFLHDLCWQDDAAGLAARLERVLAILERHRMRALVALFDSCWLPEPRSGRQEPPQPRVHNSRWLQSPGVPTLRDPARFAALRGYVQGVLDRFRADPRILAWDLWNEPDNGNPGKPFAGRDLGAGKAAAVLPLLAQAFAWAREVDPAQPLTSAVWQGDYAADRLAPIQRLQLAASDVVSFHCYGDAAAMRTCIANLEPLGRPLWCSEYMARPASTIAAILPILAERRIGAWNWGLVAGRMQTQYPWQSCTTPWTTEPDPWFHDLFHPDGRPYDAGETELVRTLAARAAAQPPPCAAS